MVVFSKFKIFVILSICFVGIVFVLPNIVPKQTRSLLPSFMRKTVNLGLDLQGGSLIQLQVNVNAVIKEHLANILSETRRSLRKQQIKYTGLRLRSDDKQSFLELTLSDLTQYDAVVRLIEKVDNSLTFEKKEMGTIVATISSQAIAKRKAEIITQSMEVVRRRIDTIGAKEPNIQQQGDDRIVLQLPGINDPAETRRLLGKTAKLSFQWVDDSVQPVNESKGTKASLPIPPVGIDYIPEESHDGSIIYLPIKKEIIIHGDTLVDARATFDNNGRPVVSIKFNNVGKRQMDDASRNVGKRFAIVLDNKVISSPSFNEPIPGGSAQISGRFTVEEANELATLLRAGALPAPLNIVEECVVGPSLGADSISYGKNAVILAFLLISIFILFVYSYIGLFADFALMINVVLLVAGLSLIGATLTLPGIAGIALTIGMAVDANVLIFERIREEIKSGLSVLGAIDQGYKRAFTAILDSNLTTILGAWILYYFGTGPVKGFSVTLALGVVISMFTALTVTQLFLVAWVKWRKTKRIPF
ncbi:MAG: protein translocase subunit SecD [Holosporales bacterium]|jgi:preprotein translocase subunit SecD|nr:protein translocase subunit SecD [Holosporales bacterium]